MHFFDPQIRVTIETRGRMFTAGIYTKELAQKKGTVSTDKTILELL